MSVDDRRRVAELDPLPPLGDPPVWLTAVERAVWYEIVRAAPDVLRAPDRGLVEGAVGMVTMVRGLIAAGVDRAEWLPHARLAYRSLGEMFVPMVDRRQLLLGELSTRRRSAIN